MRTRTSIESELARVRRERDQTNRELERARQRVRELEARTDDWPFANTHLERLHEAMVWLDVAASPLSSKPIDGGGRNPNMDSSADEGASTRRWRAARRRVEYRIRSLAEYAQVQVSGEEQVVSERSHVRCTARNCRKRLSVPVGEDWDSCPVSGCVGRLAPVGYGDA